MLAFISYSHRDKPTLEKFRTHLANLRREGTIQEWYDREILAGSPVDPEIDKKLEEADLFIFLISAHFIDSNYCVEREMLRAFERSEANEARIVPIIIDHCDWKAMPQLSQLLVLPEDGVPISDWQNENKAFLNIVQELRKIVSTGEVNNSTAIETISKPLPVSQKNPTHYKIKKEFDRIDRSEYRDAAFATIKENFKDAISEIDSEVGIRGRFSDLGVSSFSCTIINQANNETAAHITVHRGNGNNHIGDITYSFQENASANTMNGWFNVVSDNFELLLKASSFGFSANYQETVTSEQAFKNLWSEFIDQAGVSYV